MCGFAAAWGPNAPDLADAISEHLSHRGPDGRGAVQIPEPRLALVHHRLAIIDPDGGQQPLVAPGQRGALVANGMIYNDRAIRATFSSEHYATGSDSESILHACLRDGNRAVSSLDGMYAFVMQDRDRLIAARDPIGIKPLYVGRRGETFCFASEIKALSPHTDEIYEFPPGHVFDSQRGFSRYYNLRPPSNELSDAGKAMRTIRQTLTRAVEKRLRSDVPLGVFLSGGLDSSLIAALACQFRSLVKSFSVGLAGSPDLIAARKVAEHLGTDHYEYVLTEDEILRDLPDILFHLESFDRDLVRSAVPCYYVSRLAAEHVKVVLTGEGADELFAGYDYHKGYDSPDALQHELQRSVMTMHNINLQRVDRMTMAHGVEARVPFLDRELLDVAFRIPATLKLPAETRVEKWVLRKAFADLLPADIVWRDKSQFDQGSGVGELLMQNLTSDPGDADNGVTQAARDVEEARYREMLFERFDNPERMQHLVAHWDSDNRIGETPSGARATVTKALGNSSDPSGQRALENFNQLYDVESPRPYFNRMRELDYQIPESANTIYQWCVRELRRVHGTAKLTVLDLCAGYGVNGALLQLAISLEDFYAYFDSTETAVDGRGFFDRLAFSNRRKDTALNIIGLDIASKALDYSRDAGFIHKAYTANLETEQAPLGLQHALAHCALVMVTGGFSFIGSKTIEKVLAAITDQGDKRPWIVGFPPLHIDLTGVLNTLMQHGYVIQPTLQQRVRQRRFASSGEQARELDALSRSGLLASERDYFEARCLIAQPPGMPAPSPELFTRLRAKTGADTADDSAISALAS